jgi:hypothetical protein
VAAIYSARASERAKFPALDSASRARAAYFFPRAAFWRCCWSAKSSSRALNKRFFARALYLALLLEML